MFNLGDTVKLKGIKGPVMLVEGSARFKDKDDHLMCIWANWSEEAWEICRQAIPTGLLEKAEPAPAGMAH